MCVCVCSPATRHRSTAEQSDNKYNKKTTAPPPERDRDRERDRERDRDKERDRLYQRSAGWLSTSHAMNQSNYQTEVVGGWAWAWAGGGGAGLQQ